MRMILIGLTAALLSACNVTLGNNSSTSNAAAPANGAAPAPSNMAMPGNMVMPGGEEDAGGNASAGGDRDALLASCTREAREALPQSVDVNRLCACAVERHVAGATQNAAMRQCATEQNVPMPMGQ